MNDTVIDRDAFETLKTMTDPGFIAELIDVFFADTPELIAEMRSAITRAEAGPDTAAAEQLRRAAHSLKSNSASFGATRLAELAREVEMLAKEGHAAEAGPRLGALEAAYAEVQPALEELKNEL